MKNSSASVESGRVAKIPGMAACLAIGLLTAAGFSPSARADSYERVEGTFRYGDAQEVLEIVNMERNNAGVESLVMTEEQDRRGRLQEQGEGEEPHGQERKDGDAVRQVEVGEALGRQKAVARRRSADKDS